MNNTNKYNALNLLDAVIEFTNMTQDPGEWSFERQKENEPRFVRLQQIQALMNAFIPELKYSKGIRESIEDFYSGVFITRRMLENYSKLVEKIDITISKSTLNDAPKKKIGLDDLQENYRNLLKYYLRMNKLLNHNNSMVEISYPHFFPYLITNSVSESISPKALKIKSILALFIDPFKQSYTMDKMIQQYNYPDIDLLDLDLDWM